MALSELLKKIHSPAVDIDIPIEKRAWLSPIEKQLLIGHEIRSAEKREGTGSNFSRD